MRDATFGLRIIGIAAFTLAGSLAGSPAEADVLWNTYGSGYAQDYLGAGQTIHTNAQAFTLNGNDAISEINWSGIYLGSASDDFEVEIYADNGSGQPQPVGSPLDVLTQTPNSTLSSENSFGYPVYDYADVLTSPLSLGAGTYYIAINEISGANDWYWGVTSITNGSFFVADNGGAWDERTSTLAFELQGVAVPEPSSIVLMGGALTILAFARRRAAR